MAENFEEVAATEGRKARQVQKSRKVATDTPSGDYDNNVDGQLDPSQQNDYNADANSIGGTQPPEEENVLGDDSATAVNATRMNLDQKNNETGARKKSPNTNCMLLGNTVRNGAGKANQANAKKNGKKEGKKSRSKRRRTQLVPGDFGADSISRESKSSTKNESALTKGARRKNGKYKQGPSVRKEGPNPCGKNNHRTASSFLVAASTHDANATRKEESAQMYIHSLVELEAEHVLTLQCYIVEGQEHVKVCATGFAEDGYFFQALANGRRQPVVDMYVRAVPHRVKAWANGCDHDVVAEDATGVPERCVSCHGRMA